MGKLGEITKTAQANPATKDPPSDVSERSEKEAANDRPNKGMDHHDDWSLPPAGPA